MANFEVSESLRDIAYKVIDENANLSHLEEEKDRILFMYSDQDKKSKGKTVYADTELIKEKYRDILTYDFCITFYKPPTQNLTDEKIEHLMYHELRHVGLEDDKLFIAPHDIEDFRDVINSWGIDWI